MIKRLSLLTATIVLVGCDPPRPDRSAAVADADMAAEKCIKNAVAEIDDGKVSADVTLAKVKDRCSIELMLGTGIASMDDKNASETIARQSRTGSKQTGGDMQILNEIKRARAAN